MTTDLNLNLDSLTFHTPSNPTPTNTPKFTLFPTLPTELRLKIISHALPTPRTLNLTANILLADPTFGLYLVFTVTPPSKSVSNPGTWGDQTQNAPRRWYITSRRLALLAVNREFRARYNASFPLTLPTGFSAPWAVAGVIRYSARDALRIMNFASLVGRAVVSRAITEGWRLQNFWSEVAVLHCGVEVYMTEYMDCCVDALEKMKGLREVKVRLPRNYLVDGSESVKVQLLRAFRGRVRIVEGLLEEVALRRGEEGRVLPAFELLEYEEEEW